MRRLACFFALTALWLDPLPGRGLEPDRSQPIPEVHVIGVYEGKYPPGVTHRFGFHPEGAVEVKIAKRKNPVILVVTACEPVVWTVKAPKDAVVKVIASGYCKQVVKGLDDTVPIKLISQEAGDKDWFFACRREPNPNEKSENEREETKRRYAHLVERVKELTKLDIKEFQGKQAGEAFEVR
jgi:hypothetical protein